MLLNQPGFLLRYAGLVVLVAGLLSLVAACGGLATAPSSDSATAAQEEEQEAADATETGSGQATASYQVPTITCPSCAARVKASAQKDQGVLDTQVKGQHVTVAYDPAKTDPEKIAEAIRSGGDTVLPDA